jgi:predicted amidohydrolase
MKDIIVACLQYPVVTGDIHINETTYLNTINKLKNYNIDFIVLPEMWLTGFDYENLKSYSNNLSNVIENIASNLNKNTFVFSSLPEYVDENIYNTIFIISSNGIVGRYRKNMLFMKVNEHKYFNSNKEVITFQLNNINVATFLCYEIRFPELVRMATFNGNIQIMVIPAIWPSSKIDHWITLLKARAIENHCFVIGCNASYAVTKNKEIKCGDSIMVNPWGEIISQANNNSTLILELKLDEIERTKELIPSLEQARSSFNITFL